MTAPLRSQFDVIALGEGQLRLSTGIGQPLADVSQLAVHVAGTEANVLSLVARLGDHAGMVTALPNGPLGTRVTSELLRAGVDTSHVVWRDSGRVGLYFVEHASPPVPSQVIYDRERSCFAELTVNEVDWTPFESARIVHNSGITAALTENTYDLVRRSIDVARANGVTVSLDVNHRSRLWDDETARTLLSPLLADADLIFCSRRDAAALFRIDGDAAAVASALAEHFGATTVLTSNGREQTAVVDNGVVITATPPTATVVDRVGAGDALLGGFLHGYLRGDVNHGLELGIAAACLALTRHGDQLITSLSELESLAAAIESGLDILR